MNGLILGRFMPLHKGHCYLIDFALAMCQTLHICVCSRHDDTIPGNLRYEWVREQFPSALVHHITKEIPEASVGNPQAPRIWAEEIKTHITADINYFFASEDYGWEFSRHMGTVFIPLDFERHNIHISAAQIRSAPLKHWHYLSPPLQKQILMLIGIRGTEKFRSKLAQDFATKVVYPYPTRNLSRLSSALSPQEKKLLIKAEITAMHNFGFPFLFMALDELSDKQEEQTEAEYCKEVFTINSEEQYRNAHSYCKTLLNSSWNALFPDIIR